MHLVGSITGCNDGGSVMLAAIASSAARMLASSLRCLERTYQAKIAIAGNRYRTKRSGLMNSYRVVPGGMVAMMSNIAVGFPSQFCTCRSSFRRKQISHHVSIDDARDLTKSPLTRITFSSDYSRDPEMPCFSVENRTVSRRSVRFVDESKKLRDSSARGRRSSIG